ncbi:hypothetical protein J2T60_000723 [Natronospira proteinivora]|uniref:Uncharacterized protein n=1 Tax=Natronospira proteinivora TaxID=1807133 RepID=A0ABT1G8X8_9GAMM|nr:hypothetical protein [Natronospira proteinivora]MCP1726758.1 hypothetical protein [Natronospira proteinivora]
MKPTSLSQLRPQVSLALLLALPMAAQAVPVLNETLDTITVCRDGTYLNGQPFTSDTQGEGHERWPESASELRVDSFRNPEFRAIPTPPDYLVIQETADGLSGNARLSINGVTLELSLNWNEAEGLSWQKLQARIAEDEYLGIAADSIYWRPASNLVASSLPRSSLNTALEEGATLRFQDQSAKDHAALESAILARPFQQGRELCWNEAD